MYNSIRKVVITPVFYLLLASCAMFSGQESTGQYVDDSTITAKVKEAFVADDDVKASQINVETMKGVVQLSGFVASPKSESRAVELARKVHGVKSVKDNIMVSGAPPQ